MPNDDFRVTVDFSDEQQIHELGRSLHGRESSDELAKELGGRVVVSQDGPRVFLYAGSEKDARAAEQAVRRLITEHGLAAEIKPIERWFPIEEEWKDAAEPFSEAEAQQDMLDELQDHLAEWEVRIDLDDHGDATELAERLKAEGIEPIVRRWRHILIGAPTEDSAQALAERLRSELPSGSELEIEPTNVWLHEAGHHPLSVLFGGQKDPTRQDPA